MLKSFVNCKLPANFIIIEDKKDVCCMDLFVAFLMNFKFQNPERKINLVCYENAPEFYLSRKSCTVDKIFTYNYFSDPVGWKDPSTPKTDLSAFTSDSQELSETVFFIDSLSLLAYYHGFCVAYKNLGVLNMLSKKIVCVVHSDMLTLEQLEELYFLATAIIRATGFSNQNCSERVCEVIFKKPGGKVLKQEEIFNVSDEFIISNSVKESKNIISPVVKADMENLTTFKLGIHMSEEERKAKKELVLPYLKTQTQSKKGEIIYQPEIDELEDDPDNDLDI